ncbi:glycerol-3-phosphate transporter periplasmic binding protein [Enterobacter asburiae]|uniref:Glycerol-3-phosphate transporter periplasmic binding protein n=1 Tax=Enterobacter asburiae TaxID=61645 RepID=A0A376FFF3_ENTAS|nr:glycerol-3-phosphate transporter periplasmic binding protein [Enterobacter asburiae]
MQGKDKGTYKGVAEFLDFLAKPENAAEWHQKTGYLPITKAAYDLTREQGFYSKNPGADIATRQMLNKPPLPFTKACVWATCRRSAPSWMKSWKACGPVRKRHSRRWTLR